MVNDTVTCRSCGAKMFFAITAKGRRMPLDADPSPDGIWTVDKNGNLARVTADTPDDQRFHTHFETCPYANQHRKRGKR